MHVYVCAAVLLANMPLVVWYGYHYITSPFSNVGPMRSGNQVWEENKIKSEMVHCVSTQYYVRWRPTFQDVPMPLQSREDDISSIEALAHTVNTACTMNRIISKKQIFELQKLCKPVAIGPKPKYNNALSSRLNNIMVLCCIIIRRTWTK